MSGATFTCGGCQRGDVPHVARGMCKSCYDRMRRLAGGIGADVRYARWSRSMPRVPGDLVRPWAAELVLEHGTQDVAAKYAGISQRRLNALLNGAPWVAAESAEKLAMAAGRLVELALAQPPAGNDGWSAYGRFCGDDAVEGEDGCGTFFHAHHEDGLCEECFDRERYGIGPEIPRDQRVGMEVWHEAV